MRRTIQVVIQRALILLSLVFLSGCYTIAQSEYENFTSQAADKRIMNDIQLSWDIRPDASEVCAKLSKKSQTSNGPAPVACAVWTVAKKHCTIITTPNPNHVVLGHELRHCFEGHFH
jgi:TRAP-type C4-dicarboxylate transport system permease small subunit